MIAGVLWLMVSVLALPQAQPRELRGGGHLLGETAEQFFSEGAVADMLRACEAKDWKSVRRLAKKTGDALSKNAKDICAKETLAKQQATSGTRLEYKGIGEPEMMRTDTYTFDGSRLVKIDMVYVLPTVNIEGYKPKTFSELFAGLQEAYGPPSKRYSEVMRDAYGAKYDAHRAIWIGKQDVISIIEQPGMEQPSVEGRTGIIAETIGEYNRAAEGPKAANPLQ
jgi:hypothetical protein